MDLSSIEFPLVLGRLLGALRAEAGVTQRAFSREVGMGQGTLAWIEAGRSNAYAAQLLLIERGLITHGVLTRPGQVFELLNRTLLDLGLRGVTVTNGRVASLSGRDDVAALDRIVGGVVQRFLDSDLPVMMTSDVAAEVYVALSKGNVTGRGMG